MADGRFYWLKLKRDFFKRHDIRIVGNMQNGVEYLLFYIKLLCESVDHEGELRFSDLIPYSEEMIATITDTNVDIVRQAIKIFSELGMIELWNDGTLFMTEVNKMIGSAVDNDNANRQRKYRENKKALQKITHDVTKNNESKNKSKNKSKNIYNMPKIEEIRQMIIDNCWNVDAWQFFEYYDSKYWSKGKTTSKKWQTLLNEWQQRTMKNDNHIVMPIPDYIKEQKGKNENG